MKKAILAVFEQNPEKITYYLVPVDLLSEKERQELFEVNAAFVNCGETEKQTEIICRVFLESHLDTGEFVESFLTRDGVRKVTSNSLEELSQTLAELHITHIIHCGFPM